MKKSIHIVLLAFVLFSLLHSSPSALAQAAETAKPTKAVEPDGLIELNLPPSL